MSKRMGLITNVTLIGVLQKRARRENEELECAIKDSTDGAIFVICESGNILRYHECGKLEERSQLREECILG